MKNRIFKAACLECESDYYVHFIDAFVDGEPTHCPFCGSEVDDISEEYINEEDDNEDE